MRVFPRLWVPVLTAVLVCAAVPFSSQQRQGPLGTIRVRVRLVLVDVIVTDEKDRPVLDLTRDDFTILENGRSQEIGHFTVESLSAEVPVSQYKPLLRRVPAAAPRFTKTSRRRCPRCIRPPGHSIFWVLPQQHEVGRRLSKDQGHREPGRRRNPQILGDHAGPLGLKFGGCSACPRKCDGEFR